MPQHEHIHGWYQIAWDGPTPEQSGSATLCRCGAQRRDGDQYLSLIARIQRFLREQNVWDHVTVRLSRDLFDRLERTRKDLGLAGPMRIDGVPIEPCPFPYLEDDLYLEQGAA